MIRKCMLGVAVLLLATTAGADTLLLDGLEVAAQTSAQRPGRGQTMATVEARFGAPSNRVAAVGEPPISRWEYPGFTVFFEFDHVIHAVVRH